MAITISASGTSAFKRKAFHEGGHHLEKLEFALAVAESKGDKSKCDLLRSQIAALGGNVEEPGT